MSLSLENGMLTFTSDNISTTTSSFVSSNFNNYVATCDYGYTPYYLGIPGIAEITPEAAPIKKYHIKHR